MGGPSPNGTGGWIDDWDDEAPSIQGFQQFTDVQATQGCTQIQRPALLSSSQLPINQGQSLLKRPLSLLKSGYAKGEHNQAQQAPITRTRRISNQVAPPLPDAERAVSLPHQEFHIPRRIEGTFDILEQLRKTQAKISIYELIRASKKH